METPISDSGTRLTFLAACWNITVFLLQGRTESATILTQPIRQKNVLHIIVAGLKKIVTSSQETQMYICS